MLSLMRFYSETQSAFPPGRKAAALKINSLCVIIKTEPVHGLWWSRIRPGPIYTLELFLNALIISEDWSGSRNLSLRCFSPCMGCTQDCSWGLRRGLRRCERLKPPKEGRSVSFSGQAGALI